MSDQNLNPNASFKKYVGEEVVNHCLSLIQLSPTDTPIFRDKKFSTNKEKLWHWLGELFFIFLVSPTSMGPNKKTRDEFDKTFSALQTLLDLLEKQVPDPPYKKDDFNSPSQELVQFFLLFQSQQDNLLAMNAKRTPTYYDDTKELIRLLRNHISLYRHTKSDLYFKIPGRGRNKTVNEMRQCFHNFVFDIYREMTGESPKATTSDKGIENGKKIKRANNKDSKSIQLLDYLLPRFHFTENDDEPSAGAIKKMVIKYNKRKAVV